MEIISDNGVLVSVQASENPAHVIEDVKSQIFKNENSFLEGVANSILDGLGFRKHFDRTNLPLTIDPNSDLVTNDKLDHSLVGDDVVIFSKIVDFLKTNPGVEKSRNGVTGGEEFKLNGVTLTDHSNRAMGGGSPFLRLDGEREFLVMHTFEGRKDGGPKTWVEGKGIDDVTSNLTSMQARLG